MNNKKIWYVILVIGLSMIFAGLVAYKLFSASNETLPDIENVQSVEQEEPDKKADIQTNPVKESTNNYSEKTSVVNAVPEKPKQKANDIDISQVYVKNEINTEIAENERKYTPEEVELLKKVPAQNEVVVDKEIKIKSSGKYYFK